MAQNLKKVQQAAEAIIYLDKTKKKIIKERIKKGYRIKEIDDKLRKNRTRLEARLIQKAARIGVKTPKIVGTTDYTIEMEYIDGKRVKDILSSSKYTKNRKEICSAVGKAVASLHEHDIIHGDLTTSNMIMKGKQIYFIDFGLGFHSARIEDKATDLHLLQQAFESTHFDIIRKVWPAVVRAYKKNYSGATATLKRLEKIQKRGRYQKR